MSPNQSNGGAGGLNADVEGANGKRGKGKGEKGRR